MKYLIFLLFTSVSFAQEFYIDIKDINLDQWEITIDQGECKDIFIVDKNTKDLRKLAKDLVRKVKEKQ